jgi:outer membrane receptor protein involved in Fe transport
MDLPPAASPPAVEAVVVRSARLPDSPADAAFSVVRLDPVQLQVNHRLDEAVTSSPGAALFRRTSSAGANPTTQGVSLREIAPSGAGRALVTLDGVPQNDPFGGWVIWSALPTESIGGVSLIRGAGAGPYGAGALTGVVALTSVDGPTTRATLEGGSLGFRRGAVTVGRQGGRVDALLSLSSEHDDGWTPVSKTPGAADQPLSLDASSGSLRLQTDVGSAVLSGRVAAFQEERGSGLRGAASRVRGASASLTLVHTAPDASGWRLQGWANRSDLQNSSVAVAAGRASTTPANNQYKTPADGYGLNAAWRGPGGLWEVGGDLRATEGESRELFRYMNGFTRSRVAGGKAMVAGLYGEAHRQTGPWLFTGGVRIDRWSSSDGHRLERDLATGAITLNNPSPARDGWIPTARAGMRRSFGDDLYARAAAYAGFRAPTLNELHRPFRVGNDITEANPGLEPERLYGIEAAVGQAGAERSWSLTAFVNRLQDPVTNVTIGLGPGVFPVAGLVPAGGALRQRQNAGRIDAEGIEAEAERRFGTVTLHAAAAYTHAEVDGGSAAPQLTGLRPAQAPQWSGDLSAAWQATPRLNLRLQVQYESARFEDDINSRALGAAATVNARAEWALTDDTRVYLAVDNLADADVATGQTADGVYSYGPPRAVRMGVTLRR